MENQETEVGISIDAGPNADAEEIENLTVQLSNELSELDIEGVERVKRGGVEKGTKAVDPYIAGELLLTLVASGGVITSLIKALQSWITRNRGSSASVKIGKNVFELKGTSLSPEQKQQLIDAFSTAIRGQGTEND